MTSTATQAPTPGRNFRLDIWFSTDRAGRKIAHYWSYRAGRAIRLPLADAEIWAVTDAANVLPGHPWKPAA
jgi:hypothetical protein